LPKKTVNQIINSGNDYVIQAKRNQPKLYVSIQETLLEKPLDSYEEGEKGHGRHSFWSVSVFNALNNEKAKEWQGLKRFIHVHKVSFNTKTKKTSHSDRLYISNKSSISAKDFHQGIRKHWTIENSLHWVKDVIHGEDTNRIIHPNGAVNNATISTIVINLLRKRYEQSITNSQILFGADLAKSMDILRT